MLFIWREVLIIDFTVFIKGNGHPLEWKDEQIKYVIEQYRSRIPPIDIASQFGVSDYSILKIIKEEIPNEFRNLSEQRQKYTRDSKYFDSIDTEEKAYWLGFLYADGGVNTNRNALRLTLASRDRDHIKKFKVSIGSNAPIKTSKKVVGEKTFYQSFVEIGDAYLVNQLNQLGCGYNKSSTLKFPNFLGEEFITPFVRGYFDGDGSVHIANVYKNTGHKAYRMHVMGTESMVKGIQKHLGVEHLKFYQSELDKRGNIGNVQIGGNLQVEKKLELLYGGSAIHLDRKYNYYPELKQYNLSRYTKTKKE